jgi:hypothetical protein
MTEFARITHSVSGYAGLHAYSNLSSREIDTVWEKLAEGVSGTDATIAIQLEIGADPSEHGVGYSPVRPTNTMLQQLRNATAALARANAKLVEADLGALDIFCGCTRCCTRQCASRHIRF